MVRKRATRFAAFIVPAVFPGRVHCEGAGAVPCSGSRSGRPPLPSLAQPVLARAIAGLRTLTGAGARSRCVQPPPMKRKRRRLHADLEALRQEAMRPKRRSKTAKVLPNARQRRRTSAGLPRHRARRIVAHGPVADIVARAPASEQLEERAVPHVGRADTGCDCHPRRSPFRAASSGGRCDARERARRSGRAGAAYFPRRGRGAVSPGRRAVARMAAGAGQPGSGAALRRTLHTFKGSARMAGAMRLGELAHLMESRLLAGDALARPVPGVVRDTRHRSRSRCLRSRSTPEGRSECRSAVARAGDGRAAG